MPAVYANEDGAYTLPLRASILPAALNRTSTADPVKSLELVWRALDNPITVSICAPAALGVALKNTVNDADCGVNDVFTHPAPAATVKQALDCARAAVPVVKTRKAQVKVRA